MLGRLGELVHGGQLGSGGVAHSDGAVVVPDGQDTPHGDIDSAVCFGIHLLGVEQHIHDTAIHRDGAVLTVHQLVDGTEVLQPLKAVVDGEEAVVFSQLRKDTLRDLVKGFLTFGVARDGRDSIEVVKGILREFFGGLLAGGERRAG